MDEIIRRLREIDEDNVTKEDYREVGDLVSEYHVEIAQEYEIDEWDEQLNRTDRVEDALLAAAYDDADGFDVSQCILVLRGHEAPEEADLPVPSMEAFHEAIEDDPVDDEVEEIIDEIFRVIDDR